ncbi:MAG: 23S rRNA (adenine(2503)-C(2))-methyltransferase RlmN [Verrucomicrobia bacterium]|jgi:23S rRNA (adenine2503-C2)-methyltransferase|nr:23S rRNA (adenine(2503)-C(2))-methyltransferase RlmN [Verrucomicrobiota bacterium]MBT7069011.1 23S rRNA (adenine(2503)-C(2))-methyltransferase RlmN [Verrucomicrobiota bacterium]MBT7700117.1 23S rRNA (adenine(2503)-C(2))-methyltransferase RlmN [Verrucomicrobiota bacterium]
MDTQTPLFGMTLGELQTCVAAYGLPGYTARQIADWLYSKKIESIDDMSNLSKQARALLNEHHVIGRTPPQESCTSKDGTRKYLFATAHGQFIETAMIPTETRKTVCVSSQVGCKMGCVFCMTGKQGFQGQLTAGEILNQVWSIPEHEDGITNIVYMGMGEPLDNLDEVLKSIEILTSDWGAAMSPRRITVSTIGILPGVTRFLKECEAHLAISLHTPFPEERQELMPVQNAHPLEEVIDALREWDFSGQRRVSFEYIVFGGLNDSARHARELIRLLAGIVCRINLIRFHPIPGTALARTDEDTMQRFKDFLNRKGVLTTVRASRGVDIYAACGLLSTTAAGEKSSE